MLPDALAALLERVHPVPDVRIENVAPTTEPRQGMLSYLHKTKAGRNIYYSANSTEQDLTPVIQLRGEHQLECWNPHSGADACDGSRGHGEEQDKRSGA
jgi:hypothetical protein